MIEATFGQLHHDLFQSRVLRDDEALTLQIGECTGQGGAFISIGESMAARNGFRIQGGDAKNISQPTIFDVMSNPR